MSVQLYVWGRRACFSRPQFPTERVTYDAPTPSACVGILEAIHWKPAIRWHVDRITVLAPIVHEQWRNNEVAVRASARRPRIVTTDNRVQRTTLALRDVAYLIDAHFDMTDKAGPSDSPGKHVEMFKRRAARGQCWQHPCLGLREMMAAGWSDKPNREVDQSLMGERNLGMMLHSIDHATGKPRWFHAIMRDGVIDVPPVREALQ